MSLSFRRMMSQNLLKKLLLKTYDIKLDNSVLKRKIDFFKDLKDEILFLKF